MTKLKLLTYAIALFAGCLQAALPLTSFNGGELRQLRSGRQVTKGGVSYTLQGDMAVPVGAQVPPPAKGKLPAAALPAQPGPLSNATLQEVLQFATDHPNESAHIIALVSDIGVSTAADVHG